MMHLLRRKSFNAIQSSVLLLTLIVSLVPLTDSALFSTKSSFEPLANSANVTAYVSGEIVVWFYDNATENETHSTISRLGTQIINSSVQMGFGQYIKLYLLEIVDNSTVWEKVYQFWNEPIVRYAEPNSYPSADQTHQLYPNDPAFVASFQWDMLNGGQFINGGLGTIDADIDAPQAWSIVGPFTSPQTAVLDTGVGPHRDLPAARVAGMAGVAPHGTAVAGIIGAQGNNGIDIAGVDWHANILSLPGFGPGITNWNFYVSMITIMIMNVLGANIRVVNYSGHFLDPITGAREYYDPIAENLVGLAIHRSDILFVTSAGNGALDNDIGEYIYNDTDHSGTITPGDWAITPVTTFHPGPAHPPQSDEILIYPPARFVVPLDWDALSTLMLGGDADVIAGTFLVPFNPDERYHDEPPLGVFNWGDEIYWDINMNGIVNIGEMRLTPYTVVAGLERPAGSIVLLGDPDVGLPLVPFPDSVRHVDNRHIDRLARDVPHNLQYDGPAHYPSNFPTMPNFGLPLAVPDNVITVAASNHTDHLSRFSNYGYISVDLAAPGEDVPVLLLGDGWDIQSGTSFAAPHVSGVASLAFAMFPLRSAQQVKRDILIGALGDEDVPIPVPASGVDRRPPFGTPPGIPWIPPVLPVPPPPPPMHPPPWPPPHMHRILVSDGRLRWPYTGDLGDAPDLPGNPLYDTIAGLKPYEGALHWDDGNEWFHLDATNEVDAIWFPPYDQDPTANILPAPDMDLQDHPFPFNFAFFPPPPWPAGMFVDLQFLVSTYYWGVPDAEGGRYQPFPIAPNRVIYINGFFDWNPPDGDWDCPGPFLDDHVLSFAIDPFVGVTPISPLVVGGVVVPIGAIVPPNAPFLTQTILLVHITFGPIPLHKHMVMPRWFRFRLDYGENVGIQNPNPVIPPPPVLAPPPAVPGFMMDQQLPIWLPSYRARFGEVEDFTLQFKNLDVEPPILINLTEPLNTQWSELYPEYGRRLSLNSWHDANYDGILDPSDYVTLSDMDLNREQEPYWWYVDNVTVTLKLTKKATAEIIYVELEDGWAGYYGVITLPRYTDWFEKYPSYGRRYTIIEWYDNCDSKLSYCDRIILLDRLTMETAEYHVEAVKTDLIISPRYTLFSEGKVKDYVGEGYMQTTSLFMDNYYPNTTEFTISAYYNGLQPIGNQTIILNPMESGTAIIPWTETATLPKGTYNYNITIYVYAHDTLVYATTFPAVFKITVVGDINGDGKVDIKDVYIAALAFGSYPGHVKWNPNADINSDNKVDVKDYYKICRNYGKTDPQYVAK
jgi:subtilisin family serine protease